MDHRINVAPVRLDIRVKASQEHAFEVFTSRMGRWWNPSHSINASPQKDIVVEGRPGGRWFEVGENGAECDWGKVLVWEPPERVVFAWQLSADWAFDPDLQTELELHFIPEGQDTTRVELEHRDLERFGERAEAVRDSLHSPRGWQGLLSRYVDLLGRLGT
jgi:uncharacterized protein YndB with AHSA1/START domain